MVEDPTAKVGGVSTEEGCDTPPHSAASIKTPIYPTGAEEVDILEQKFPPKILPVTFTSSCNAQYKYCDTYCTS